MRKPQSLPKFRGKGLSERERERDRAGKGVCRRASARRPAAAGAGKEEERAILKLTGTRGPGDSVPGLTLGRAGSTGAQPGRGSEVCPTEKGWEALDCRRAAREESQRGWGMN